MSLAFHPDALDEYLAAIRAHDEAGAFVEAVARSVSQAARWPKSGTLEPGYAVEVRRFIIPRFRYRLHVAMLSPPVVIAVSHERRDPTYWRSRLT
jgi:plasmid stabilization system protein ParE